MTTGGGAGVLRGEVSLVPVHPEERMSTAISPLASVQRRRLGSRPISRP